MYFNNLILLITAFFYCCSDHQPKSRSLVVLKMADVPTDTIPLCTRLISKAMTHLSKPYLAHTLDKSDVEQLTIRMDGFDCTTLVETVIAQALDSAQIEDHIKMTRYRNGTILDYASRIHYFTEWIYENQKNGFVKDVTSGFSCSKPFVRKINFMTQHRSRYPQLRSDTIFNKIRAMEHAINTYKWHYIPKQNLASCEKDIKHGDIIAITSNVPGLDIAHLGFAFRKGNNLYLLHASTDEKKVVITEKTLEQYLMAHKKQSGVIVVRVKNFE